MWKVSSGGGRNRVEGFVVAIDTHSSGMCKTILARSQQCSYR